MRFWDDGRGIDLNRLLTTQQAGQSGQVIGSGTFTMGAINVTGAGKNGVFVLTGPLGSPGVSQSASDGSSQALVSMSGLAGDITVNINPGQETRVRNAPIMPCIVDG